MQRANASFCQRAPRKSHSHYGSPGFLATNNAGLTRDESYLPTDSNAPSLQIGCIGADRVLARTGVE
jgi:hypothetical protein